MPKLIQQVASLDWNHVSSQCRVMCLMSGSPGVFHTVCQAGVNRLLLVTSPTATLTVMSKALFLSERPLNTGRRRKGHGPVEFLKALERTTNVQIFQPLKVKGYIEIRIESGGWLSTQQFPTRKGHVTLRSRRAMDWLRGDRLD